MTRGEARKELVIERAKVRKLEDENQRLTAKAYASQTLNLRKPLIKAPTATLV